MKKWKVICISILFILFPATYLLPAQADTVLTNREFAAKAIEAAMGYHTIYANGMFGMPITPDSIEQKVNQDLDWYTPERIEYLESLIGEGYFGFDSLCFVKGLIWGWNGSINDRHGGAIYGNNGLEDVTDKQLIGLCTEVSTDFSEIMIGELLYREGGYGIYVGNGFAVECTPNWKNGIQITAVSNIGSSADYPGRQWYQHGKLPFVSYLYSSLESVAPRILEAHYSGNSLEVMINGNLNDGAWIGVYPNTQTAYDAAHPADVWHYLNDSLVVSVDSFEGFDFTRIRIPAQISNGTSKVVLFQDSGYSNIAEHPIAFILSHPDQPNAGFISTDSPALTVDQESVQIGEPIDITFYGVTNKDAWIGLYRSEEVDYEPCETGMWCYTATGKQWMISKKMNTVRNGKVRFYANILDNYTGTLLNIEPGLYKMVLFQNAGYTPSAISDTIKISDH